MKIRPALLALSILLAGCALAPAADAQELGIQLHGKHVAIGFQLGHARAPACPPPRPIRHVEREWIPGHFETVSESVWVASREERTWVEAEFGWHYDACGRAHRVCLRPGYWKTVCVPGHFEDCARQVWVEGGWRMRPCRP